MEIMGSVMKISVLILSPRIGYWAFKLMFRTLYGFEACSNILSHLVVVSKISSNIYTEMGVCFVLFQQTC